MAATDSPVEDKNQPGTAGQAAESCAVEQKNQQKANSEQACQTAAVLPDGGAPSVQFCLDLQRLMHKATWAGVQATKEALPAGLLQAIVLGVTPILAKEPTVVEIHPAASQQRVTVVGDTHGQYHDLCKLFELYGHPSSDRVYIFNGDYVDRGAWGVETLTLLLAWKWLLPNNVYLIRGNHETNMITRIYGFYAEVKAKYGPAAKGLFTHIRRMFAHLPLAALVQGSTLILHGGLFRAPPSKGKGSKRRRSGGSLAVGTLDDLRKASKGGQDPDPERSVRNMVASDVVWSDPVNAAGLRPNEARGCGTVFGPDVTECFLSSNGLKLIIRSHEGPDARDKRDEDNKMPSVDSGYAVDHDTASGRLVTLFSAPDYPQFMAEGEQRYNNQAAVLHLTAPDYATPAVDSFEADLPRPQAESYYDLPGFSDDDDELAEQQQDDEQPPAAAASADALPADKLTADTLAADALPVVSLAAAGPTSKSSEAASAAEMTAHAAKASAVPTENAQEYQSGMHSSEQQQRQPGVEAAKDLSEQQQGQRQVVEGRQETNQSAAAKGISRPCGVPVPLSPLQQQELSMSLQQGVDGGPATTADPTAAGQHDVSATKGSFVDEQEPPSKKLRAVG